MSSRLTEVVLLTNGRHHSLKRNDSPGSFVDGTVLQTDNVHFIELMKGSTENILGRVILAGGHMPSNGLL